MNRVVHFEIPVSDPEKAIAFFEKVFGWKFSQFGNMDYWSVETGAAGEPGINGGLMRKRDPQQPVVNTIQVADIDAMMKTIEAAGGKIVVPKMPIPAVGWLAYFTDPEGNIHGVMQEDRSAK